MSAVTVLARQQEDDKGPANNGTTFKQFYAGARFREPESNQAKPGLLKSASYTQFPHLQETAYTDAETGIRRSLSEERFAILGSSTDILPFRTTDHTDVASSRTPQSPATPAEYELAAEQDVDDACTDEHEPSHETFVKRLSRRLTTQQPRSTSPTKKIGTELTSADPVARDAHEIEVMPGQSPRRHATLKRHSGARPAAKTSDAPRTTTVRSALQRTKTMISSSSFTELPTLRSSSSHSTGQNSGNLASTPNIAGSGFKRRDELWTVFRSLDADFARFMTKSTALKANFLRQSLLAFLRNYRDNTSIDKLAIQDLDRRIAVLDKWWRGLIDVLQGRHNATMSGTDRPAVLDAISGIMARPEWSSYAALSDENDQGNLALGRMDAHPKFVQSLTSQLSYIVEKMSQRHAPASLVTFCGKALAYAFYYCPSVASALIQGWSLQPGVLRRVLKQYRVSTSSRDASGTDSSSSKVYPSVLQSLEYSGLHKLLSTLREFRTIPLGLESMQWHGYWLSRWQGRESDLFFAFVKSFYILTCRCLLPQSQPSDLIRFPGMLHVQAQILSNLDTTVHRSSQGHGPGDMPVNISLAISDLLGEHEATGAIQSSLANANRLMAENRLIMLVRDVLSENCSEDPVARHMFASTFQSLIEQCVSNIPVHNHAACSVLCDFMEEALLILTRFERFTDAHGFTTNIPFFISVIERMLHSQNVMTEIRACTFVYSAYHILCMNTEHKSQLELGLLLSENVFCRGFLHWCPLVRAYFMRLLCWKVARIDGSTDRAQSDAVCLMAARLQDLWTLYVSMQERGYKLSTAPCKPAPGRRLAIVRTDDTGNRAVALWGFDGRIPPFAPRTQQSQDMYNMGGSSGRTSRAASTESSEGESEHDTDGSRDPGLKKFIKGIIGQSKKSSATQAQRSSSQLASIPNHNVEVKKTRSESGQCSLETVTPQNTQCSICFKFSLEYDPRLATPNGGNFPLAPPRMPLMAQRFLDSHVEGGAPAIGSSLSGLGSDNVKYLGRALAEWALVVSECQNFLERRTADGNYDERLVESPMLTVEMCRR